MSNPQSDALLNAAKSATATGGYIFANPKSPVVKSLVGAGLLTLNGDIVNPENKDQVAVRATDEAMHQGAPVAGSTTPAANSTPATTAPRAARPTIAIDEPMDLIKSKRGGARPETYPFADLPAPTEDGKKASFFVPASDTMPDPARSLASTVSSATKRYGDRKFVIRAVEKDPKYGVKGARIFRDE